VPMIALGIYLIVSSYRKAEAVTAGGKRAA
jgi:hypothetical protein